MQDQTTIHSHGAAFIEAEAYRTLGYVPHVQSMRASMRPGLAAVADRYRGFIVDLWGVVHDGERPYPGAVATLQQLRISGAAVCLLSNSPRRASEVAAKLHDMGIGPRSYDHLVTSGEETFEALQSRRDGRTGVCGRRCLHLGPQHLAALFAGLDIAMADGPHDADFVVATGIDAAQPAEDLAAVMLECAARHLPMICANPDLVVLIGERVHPCAGELARRYELLGGTVIYYGKPHSSVYRRCLERLDLETPDVLAVGDALRTDVAGANAMGIDVAFVTGGIHREELGSDWGALPHPERLQDLFVGLRHWPTLIVPSLCW